MMEITHDFFGRLVHYCPNPDCVVRHVESKVKIREDAKRVLDGMVAFCPVCRTELQRKQLKRDVTKGLFTGRELLERDDLAEWETETWNERSTAND